jgi:hypothetical protein
MLVGCGDGSEGGAGPDDDGAYRSDPAEVDGLQLPARVEGPAVALASGEGFSPRFWPGVNLGTTIPGRSPGESAAGPEQYREWIPAMANLGIRVVRVYTLLDSSFYRELAAYNEANPDQPLYVIHGIWIPEEEVEASGDLWNREVLTEQKRLIDEVYAAASGDFQAPERLGEASGTWDADIRRWIIGWSFGIELDPNSLERSERLNPPRTYDGRYVRTLGEVSSTEAWEARHLDYLAAMDAEAGWSRPVTFTNWLTLDPFDHPTEDLVSVDATKLEASERWPGGLFASYHAYPYYPDFLRYEYEDAEDPYAAYLRDLRAYHGEQAVMITEFGVPSSLGSAHLGPLGRDQGDHTEVEAMEMDAELLRMIQAEGLAGGIVFEWIDEWFKLTWNTVELELPADRRQLWRNALTNEEHFGIWAAEAGLESEVTIDGSESEWESGDAGSQTVHEAETGIHQIRAAHDEAYLYLTLRYGSADSAEGSVLGIDVRDGENVALPWLTEPRMPEAEVAIRMDAEEIEIARAAWTDDVAHQFGLGFGYINVDPRELSEGSGEWRRPQQLTNRPYRVPTTEFQNPVEALDLGNHAWADEKESSLTLGQRDSEVVELRIPWALLGFSDPSSREVLDLGDDGSIDSETLPADRELGLSVYDAEGEPLAEGAAYGWEPWQTADWSQRPKAGIGELQSAFEQTATGGSP